MQQKLILTGDGSHSIEVPHLKVKYHSIHGAIQESTHVFINAGLRATQMFSDAHYDYRCPLRILEMGFGTGLNALLTLIESQRLAKEIYYECLELFPLGDIEVRSLNYCTRLERQDLQQVFERMHWCEWEKETMIAAGFRLKKLRADLLNVQTSQVFDLVYFDAFDPNVQPELWTPEIFAKLFSALAPGGILVTYSSKGSVQRAMRAAGFTVVKVPGPPGKKEIIRAIKPLT